MSDFILSEEEQQQVDEGEAADFLLDNPMFLLAIERIRKECSEGILTSRPEDHAVREQLYNLSRGLSAVTAELANMSSVATSIRAAMIECYQDYCPLEELDRYARSVLSEEGQDKLPPIPAKGDLDLEEVRNARYAFA